MKTLVINDLHIGVQRTGGTTLASAAALREFALDKFKTLLQLAPTHGCGQVVINGDLADAYDIPLAQSLEMYQILDEFAQAHSDVEVLVATGNHDLSKSSDRLGAVAFIGKLLELRHRSIRLLDKPTHIGLRTHVIPHVPNQDIFDLELSRIPEDTRYVLLHCNYDNKFASEADHSLNLSREQAKALKARGIKMILGHEHQGRESLGGSVVIVGNQFPTSVSDCLAHGDAQKEGTKHALIIDHHGDSHEYVQTWSQEDGDGWFARIDWRELASVEEEGRGFIRVEGEADADEAAEVIKAISTFRQKSKSFVVTNAVKITQADAPQDLSASVEEIKSLSVIDLLFEELTEPQRQKLRQLMEESNG